MEVLNKIQQVAGGNYFKYTSSSELVPGKTYKCNVFMFVNTKFGRKVMMVLDENLNVILPNNVCNLIASQYAVDLLNQNFDAIKFLGMDQNTNQALYEFISTSEQYRQELAHQLVQIQRRQNPNQ